MGNGMHQKLLLMLTVSSSVNVFTEVPYERRR